MTPQQKREMLAEAQCNPRTLTKWLQGRPMRAEAKQRLDVAARALGLRRPRDTREKRARG